MRAQATPPRRIWPWIIGITVVAIIAIAVTVTLQQAGVITPTAGPTQTAEPSSTAPTAPADAAPTGCLGGPARDAAMILAATEVAPLTESGAVDLAASFVRWIQRFPYPSAAEAETVQGAVLASESFTDDLVQYLADEPDLSGGVVAPGTEYYMSTVPGVWYVESSSSDQVVVSIGTAYVIQGALSPTLRSSITVTLVANDGRWAVSDANGTRTTADLYGIGQQFTGGC